MDLPIFYLEINEELEESGVDAISFVDAPATDVAWHKFSKPELFKKDEARRVVTSPVMLAETEIFRSTPSMGDYLVKFSEDTIFKMMQKYFKDNKIHRVNEDHNSKAEVNNVTMIESFVVGDRVTSELYPNIPKGSWVASFYIQDKDYWDNVIMSDEFTGFSLEGSFDLVEVKMSAEPTEEDLFNELKKLVTEGKTDEEILTSLREKLNGEKE